MIVAGSRDPRCRGRCKGERAAFEGPARFGHLPDGSKVVWCPCCEGILRAEGILDVKGRPPNLSPEVNANSRRFIDDVCNYDTVVLRDVLPV